MARGLITFEAFKEAKLRDKETPNVLVGNTARESIVFRIAKAI